MLCKNCNAKLKGKFCSNCGQNIKVDKINFNYLIKELSNTIFQINHGLFFTIKKLFVSPGHSINEFLLGKRKNYFKPIAYVLLLATIYALIAKIIGGKTILDEALIGWNEAYKTSNSSKEKEIATLSWFIRNYAYTTLILLPFFSLASYIVFLESKYNYFEHIVLNLYITGQQALIYSFFLIIYSLIENPYIELIQIIIGVGYVFWTYIQFFKKKNILKIALLTTFSYFIYFFFILIFIAILLIISKLNF